MTFEEAMAAAKAGHAVRRAYWGRKKQDAYLLDAGAMEATDWMIADHECLSFGVADQSGETQE